VSAAAASEPSNAVEPAWSERAYNTLLRFLETRLTPFLTEDVRVWADEAGLPGPPDRRAWGSIIKRAAKAEQIVKVGYAPAESSNMSPKVQWLPVVRRP